MFPGFERKPKVMGVEKAGAGRRKRMTPCLDSLS